jgi:hypothetical protein
MTLDWLVVDTDGTVTVHVTQHLGRHLLPGLVAKLIPGDLKSCTARRGERPVTASYAGR